MSEVICPRCHGAGHEVVAKGSGLARDYKNTCAECRGTGRKTVYKSASPVDNTATSSRNTNKASGGSIKGSYVFWGLVAAVLVVTADPDEKTTTSPSETGIKTSIAQKPQSSVFDRPPPTSLRNSPAPSVAPTPLPSVTSAESMPLQPAPLPDLSFSETIPGRHPVDYESCKKYGDPSDYYVGALAGRPYLINEELFVPFAPGTTGKLFYPEEIDLYSDGKLVYFFYGKVIRTDISKFIHNDRDHTVIAVMNSGEHFDLGVRISCLIRKNILQVNSIYVTQTKDGAVVHSLLIPIENVM